MSDPYVVLVSIDFSPWDSDSESEPRIFEFSGPDEAQKFRDEVHRIAVSPLVATVQVYDPEVAYRFGSAEQAVGSFKDWLDEEDDDAATAAVPTGD